MKFYCVLGDHDRPKRRRDMPPQKLFEIRVLGENELEWEEVNGVLIAGISNMRSKRVKELREELKKFDSIESWLSKLKRRVKQFNICFPTYKLKVSEKWIVSRVALS